MRAQYHLRGSEHGLLAWDVRKLVERTVNLDVIEVSLDSITELDEPFWFDHEGDTPTCRSVASHAKLIEEVDLAHPVILDPEGRVMDGMHRVCKALNSGLVYISAYQLSQLPSPDFVGVAVEDLPYE